MATVSSVTKFFPVAKEGFATTLASTIASGAATVPLNSVAGYSNGDTIVLVVEPASLTNKQVFTGIVDTSGVQLTSVVWTEGTNVTHNTGASVVDYVTATHMSMLTKGILVSHNADGTIKNNAITSAAQITDGIITDAEMATAVKPSTLFNENTFDHIASGCVITADSAGSSLNGSITSGVVYINGKRLTVAAVNAHPFTTGKDDYVDLLDNGDGTAVPVYTSNTTDTASPVLAANSIRLAIAVSATNLTGVTTGATTSTHPTVSGANLSVTDSLGNLIGPRDPNRKLLGYRQITSNATQTATSSTVVVGLLMAIIIPTNRKMKISAGAPFMQNSADANNCTIEIFEGATTGGTKLISSTATIRGAAGAAPTYADITYTPGTTGAKSYVVSFWVSAGTGTLSAASTGPAWIKAELE